MIILCCYSITYFAQVTHRKSLQSDAALSAEGQGYAVGLQYLPDQGGACLATANGNLVLWTLDINEVRIHTCI